MKNLKRRAATVASVVALGGLAGLAISAGKQPPGKTVADRPAVRTKVIRRTIHVTRHAKPRHPAATGGGGNAGGEGGSSGAYGRATTGSSSTGAAPSSSYSSEPVTTSSSGSVPSSSGYEGGESAPVTTSTSGAGPTATAGAEPEGGGEVEVADHEGGEGGADD